MSKVYDAVKRSGKWVVGAATLVAGSAMAAVPAEVTTALGDAKTDGVTIATTVFVAIVVLFAFGLMRKALR